MEKMNEEREKATLRDHIGTFTKQSERKARERHTINTRWEQRTHKHKKIWNKLKRTESCLDTGGSLFLRAKERIHIILISWGIMNWLGNGKGTLNLMRSIDKGMEEFLDDIYWLGNRRGEEFVPKLERTASRPTTSDQRPQSACACTWHACSWTRSSRCVSRSAGSSPWKTWFI